MTKTILLNSSNMSPDRRLSFYQYMFVLDENSIKLRTNDNEYILNGNIDLTNYYTTEEIDEKLDNITIGDVDLSNYYTIPQTDTLFSQKANVSDITRIDGEIETINNSLGSQVNGVTVEEHNKFGKEYKFGDLVIGHGFYKPQGSLVDTFGIWRYCNKLPSTGSGLHQSTPFILTDYETKRIIEVEYDALIVSDEDIYIGDNIIFRFVDTEGIIIGTYYTKDIKENYMAGDDLTPLFTPPSDMEYISYGPINNENIDDMVAQYNVSNISELYDMFGPSFLVYDEDLNIYRLSYGPDTSVGFDGSATNSRWELISDKNNKPYIKKLIHTTAYSDNYIEGIIDERSENYNQLTSKPNYKMDILITERRFTINVTSNKNIKIAHDLVGSDVALLREKYDYEFTNFGFYDNMLNYINLRFNYVGTFSNNINIEIKSSTTEVYKELMGTKVKFTFKDEYDNENDLYITIPSY